MVSDNKISWVNFDQYTDAFLKRVKAMALFIDEGSSVLDMGCGPMLLKSHLPVGCTYYPVDYIRRDDSTIVCDFNKYEFPDKTVDIIFCSGIIEYINDYRWFINNIYKHSRKCIASYNPVEYTPNPAARSHLGWVNTLSIAEFIECFESAGFYLREKLTVPDPRGDNELIALFER